MATSDLDEATLSNMLEDGSGTAVAVLDEAEDEDLQELMTSGPLPGGDGNGAMGEGELEGFQPWSADDESNG